METAPKINTKEEILAEIARAEERNRQRGLSDEQLKEELRKAQEDLSIATGETLKLRSDKKPSFLKKAVPIGLAATLATLGGVGVKKAFDHKNEGGNKASEKNILQQDAKTKTSGFYTVPSDTNLSALAEIKKAEKPAEAETPKPTTKPEKAVEPTPTTDKLTTSTTTNQAPTIEQLRDEIEAKIQAEYNNRLEEYKRTNSAPVLNENDEQFLARIRARVANGENINKILKQNEVDR